MGLKRARIWRRVRKFLLVVVGLYFIALAVAFWLHVPDALIIHAAPGPLDHPGASESVVKYGGGQLEMCRADSAGARKKGAKLFVLFFVGNEDRVNLWTAGVAQMWEDQTGVPTEAWGANLPGFGLSSGPAYLAKSGPAGLAAFDTVASAARGSPVVVQAASLGTLAAMYVGAHRPVAGMTIQDPPPLRDLVLEYQGWWNAWLLSGPVALWLPGAVNSIANARACSAPCVFITSGADTVIPPPFQQRIVDAYGGVRAHVIIPNARHCSQPDPVTAEELARDRVWMVERIFGSGK